MTWRVSLPGRLACWLGAGVTIAMVVAITVEEKSPLVFLAATSTAALPVLILVRMARARLTLTDSELIYVGTLGQTVIDRGDIQGVVAGSYGLAIHRESNWNTANVWAIQKSPISDLVGRRTRADRIVEQIESWAEEIGHPADSPESRSSE